MSIKQSIASAAGRTIWYEPIRDAYQFALNREWWRRRKAREEFYGQFVHPYSLVFDIGANVGDYTRTFLTLGAWVLAVDPLPACAERLRCIPDKRLIVVQSAVGGALGQGTIHADKLSFLSSLSDGWLATARKTPRFQGCEWKQEISVPITTLDALISTHGMPHFIKIDVEGYEPQVLDGLSIMPPYLSFEFQAEWIDAALSCLRKPCFESGTEFNYFWGEAFEGLVLDKWVSAEEMAAIIVKTDFTPASNKYGDIIARRAHERI